MKNQFLSFLFLVFTASLLASPSTAIWHAETILGANNENYYVLQNIRNTGNTYYNYTDSTFVVGRNLATGKEIKKVLVRVTEHKDTTANNDWIAVEIVDVSFNILSLMKSEELFPVYHSDIVSVKDFSVGNFGEIHPPAGHERNSEVIPHSCDTKTTKNRELVYSVYRNSYFDIMSESTGEVKQSNSYYFISIAHGEYADDLDYYQSFIVVDKEDFIF